MKCYRYKTQNIYESTLASQLENESNNGWEVVSVLPSVSDHTTVTVILKQEKHHGYPPYSSDPS